MSKKIKRQEYQRGQDPDMDLKPSTLWASIDSKKFFDLTDEEVEFLMENSKPVTAPLLNPYEIFHFPCETTCKCCKLDPESRPYACCIMWLDYSPHQFVDFDEFLQAVNYGTFPFKFKRFSLHRFLF